jgi:hypothetical protein
MRDFLIGIILGTLLAAGWLTVGYQLATLMSPTCPRCQQILNNNYEFDLDNLRSC